MARAYDRSLVDRMQAGVSHVEEDGLLIELRPIPDDDRPHALDPRVYEATLPKLSFAGKDLPLGDVHAMRRRPAKPTLAIGAREVRSETRLAWMGGHGIYVHLWIPNGLPEKAPVAVYLHGGLRARALTCTACATAAATMGFSSALARCPRQMTSSSWCQASCARCLASAPVAAPMRATSKGRAPASWQAAREGPAGRRPRHRPTG